MLHSRVCGHYRAALYVTTLYLRDSDVKVEVATVDRALRKALEEADVTVHVKPWV
jgi:hypothetical protein